MTLLLRESDVSGLVTMGDAVEAVEKCFAEMRPPHFSNTPRSRSVVPGAVLNGMHAAVGYLGRGGAKLYLSTKAGGQFVFLLFDLRTGELLSVMGADILGRFRTGAASAVATKHLCKLKSFTLGVAGSGRQAVTQALALNEVASLEQVRIWSPDRAHRIACSKLLERDHGIESVPSDSVEEAVRGAQVASTITSSRTPFLLERHLRDVKHLNVCGSNWADRAEVEPKGIAVFDSICVDDLVQSRIESGDLILASKEGLFEWEDAIELRDVVQAKVTSGPRTLFKSNGVAVEDMALASVIYDRATEDGLTARFDFTGEPSAKWRT